MKGILLALAVLVFLPTGVRAAGDEDPCKTLAVSMKPAPAPAKAGTEGTKRKEDLTPDLVPLSLVICEVQHALDAYQGDRDVQKGSLPKLLTADFDFKTVLDTKGSFGISILIFKIGVSYDKQTTNDVDFQYEPKSRQTITIESLAPPKNFQQQLIDTIKAAAKAKVEQERVQSLSQDPLVFKQLGITLSYGVTKDINAGAAIPIHLVTLSPGIDRSKNSVQSVKLVFAEKK